MSTFKTDNNYLEEKIKPKLLSLLRDLNDFLQKKKVIPIQWFLYGSFTKGTAQKRSDIDVGVLFSSPEELSKFYKLFDFFKDQTYRIEGHKIDIIGYVALKHFCLKDLFPKAINLKF